MLVILSPAKTQDFASDSPPFQTTPLFAEQTGQLLTALKALSPQALESLLKISPKLAHLNFERYMQFDSRRYDATNSKACIFAYQGDVYQGLQAAKFTKTELDFANAHMLILSGLYGALRPLDAIQPYRLEMATKGVGLTAKNLYDFWQAPLVAYINARLQSEKVLLNLASHEYFHVLEGSKLAGTVIQVSFQDWSKNQFKIIGLFAKKARGMMARFIIENQISDPAQLQHFSEAGYQFKAMLSSDNHYVFQRRGT